MPQSLSVVNLIREKSKKDALIFLHLDGGYYFVSQMFPYNYDNKPRERKTWSKSEIQSYVGGADAMVGMIGEPVTRFFSEFSDVDVYPDVVFTPVSPFPFPTPNEPDMHGYNNLPKPLDFNQRSKVLMMQHTTLNWLDTHLAVVKRLGRKAIVLGSYDYQLLHMITQWTQKSGVECEIYSRFSPTVAGLTYMETINRGLIGIEDQYVGGSRFSLECAVMKVPVVGTRWAGFLEILAPELTVNNGDIDGMTEKAERLVSDENYYNEMREKMFGRLWYFTPEKSKERLFNLIRKYRPNLVLP